MGAITVAHFAAIPWLSRRVPVDPCDREELEKHKHEILLVARTMLGYDAGATGTARWPGPAASTTISGRSERHVDAGTR
jgi:hypothetical protein